MTTMALTTGAVARAFARYRGVLIPIAIVSLLGVLLFPLPSGILSFLLLVNVTLAILIMLTTVYVREPLEFGVFPSVLLITTLFRLVLNVASTRLILSRAYILRTRGRRFRHQGLRLICRRRLATRRLCHLLDPRHHPVRRHHQGRHPHL